MDTAAIETASNVGGIAANEASTKRKSAMAGGQFSRIELVMERESCPSRSKRSQISVSRPRQSYPSLETGCPAQFHTSQRRDGDFFFVTPIVSNSGFNAQSVLRNLAEIQKETTVKIVFAVCLTTV